MEIPIISIQNLFLGKLNLQQLQKVSESNIWFSQFKLNLLEGDIVSFAETFLFSALEGEAKFWITLYIEGNGGLGYKLHSLTLKRRTIGVVVVLWCIYFAIPQTNLTQDVKSSLRDSYNHTHT